MTSDEIKMRLAHNVGSDQWYRHFLGGVYTQGVEAMAEMCGAYWLIDAVFSHRLHKPVFGSRKEADRDEMFIWELTVNEDGAVLTAKHDTNSPILVEQKIEFTNFPMDYIKLYQIGETLLLPSEY